MAVAFFANPADRILHNIRFQWHTRIEDPDALLLVHTPIPSRRSQNDSVFRTLQLDGVAGAQLQFVPYRLGQYDSSSLIHRNCGNHDVILPYKMAFMEVLDLYLKVSDLGWQMGSLSSRDQTRLGDESRLPPSAIDTFLSSAQQYVIKFNHPGERLCLTKSK